MKKATAKGAEKLKPYFGYPKHHPYQELSPLTQKM
jgi:hypothetical protein